MGRSAPPESSVTFVAAEPLDAYYDFSFGFLPLSGMLVTVAGPSGVSTHAVGFCVSYATA